MSATCRAARSGWSGSIRPASSLLRVITDREWPSRSCRSRASRSRSSLAARWATVARASRNAIVVRMSSRTPVMAKPPSSAGTSSPHSRSLPPGTANAAAVISAHAPGTDQRDSREGRAAPDAMETYTNSTSHSRPRVSASRADWAVSTAREPSTSAVRSPRPARKTSSMYQVTNTASPSQPRARTPAACPPCSRSLTGALRYTSQMAVHSTLTARCLRLRGRCPMLTPMPLTPARCPSGTAGPRSR